MSRDLTQKQEAFAQAYVETNNGAESYRRAYNTKTMSDNAIWREACLLVKHPKVSQRILQLRQGHQEAHDITIAKLTAMTIEAYNHAQKDDKGASAMVSAVTTLGKLHGLIIDKKHVTSKTDKSDMTDAQLAAIAAGRSPGATEPETVETSSSSIH